MTIQQLVEEGSEGTGYEGTYIPNQILSNDQTANSGSVYMCMLEGVEGSRLPLIASI